MGSCEAGFIDILCVGQYEYGGDGSIGSDDLPGLGKVVIIIEPSIFPELGMANRPGQRRLHNAKMYDKGDAPGRAVIRALDNVESGLRVVLLDLDVRDGQADAGEDADREVPELPEEQPVLELVHQPGVGHVRAGLQAQLAQHLLLLHEVLDGQLVDIPMHDPEAVHREKRQPHRHQPVPQDRRLVQVVDVRVADAGYEEGQE